MKTKIAVFGREKIIDRLQTCIAGQTDIEIVPFIYTQAQETIALVDKAFMCDIYLFTEASSFVYAREIVDKKHLPAVQITCDDYMVLTSLFYAKNNQKTLNRLSTDVCNKYLINEVLTALSKNDHQVYTYDYKDDVNIGQIVTFHRKLWEDGKIDYVLTSIKEVEQQLKDKNIPATCMEIPTINMERAIGEAKSIATLNKKNSTQIVAGYVDIKNSDSLKENKREFLTQIHQVLQPFAYQTDASIVITSDHRLLLFGTGKILNYITSHYRDFPLLQRIKSTIQVPFAVGFGLGLTVKEAESNAKIALDRCSQSEKSNCYLVNERQDTIGPLGVKKHIDPAQLYQALIHKARLNNDLSYNFIEFITDRNNEPFSSNDIALYYRVTKRSAERTINKLLLGKVIKTVGEEKPYVKGRPRKLFQIVM